jgi:hypothetical protein
MRLRVDLGAGQREVKVCQIERVDGQKVHPGVIEDVQLEQREYRE